MPIVFVAYCFVLMGKGFQLATTVLGSLEPSLLQLHHELMISGEEMHPLVTIMVSIMASNI